MRKTQYLHVCFMRVACKLHVTESLMSHVNFMKFICDSHTKHHISHANFIGSHAKTSTYHMRNSLVFVCVLHANRRRN